MNTCRFGTRFPVRTNRWETRWKWRISFMKMARLPPASLVSSARTKPTAARMTRCFSAQWALKNTGQNQGTAGIDINYLPAREVTQGSSDIIVAVLDHGTQLDHPDLNVSSKSYDTETGRSPSQIWGNHGTACSGIISANISVP